MAAANRHDPGQPDELDDHDRVPAMHHLDPAEHPCPAAFVPAEPEALASPFDESLDAADFPPAAHHGLVVPRGLLPLGDEPVRPHMFVNLRFRSRQPQPPAMHGPVIPGDPLERQRAAMPVFWYEKAIFTEEHADGGTALA